MSLMQAVDRMIEALDAFEGQRVSLEERLDRMESLLCGLEQGLQDLRLQIDTVTEQIAGVEAALPDMQTVIQNQEREERLRWRKEVKAAQAVTKLLESTY